LPGLSITDTNQPRAAAVMPRRHHLSRSIVAAAVLALAAGCQTILEPAPPPGSQIPELQTLPRSLSAAEQSLISSSNSFSFALFRQVVAASKDSNVFASPLSADMALGMTMGGAAGATYDQMRATLGFGTASDADINLSYQGLLALLTTIDPTSDIRVANSIWYRNGFPFNQSFLDASKANFNASVKGLDFAQPAAVTSINDWVSTATSGKILTIIDKISADQVMFLINAIYFKGNWRDRFDAAETKDDVFHGVVGNQPMRLMHRHGTLRLLSRSDLTAVDLPYGNGAYSMTVLLPATTSSVDQVAATLTPDAWNALVGQLHEVTSDLWMPKLKLEWERTLNGDLKALGMRDAFIPDGADFTRMSPRGLNLYIDKVKQKTYVDINEEGTEAAAVTAVGITTTAAIINPQFRADHPFIFVIRERLTGTIMFMGKIVRMP
jgi:serpin B